MSFCEPIFELTDVTFAYEGGFALNIPALRIEPAERVACIGPSGTGKTTLIRLMTGEVLPAHGDVNFAGRTVSAMSDTQRRALRIENIGLVFQEFELLEYLSALENITLPYHVAGHLRAGRDVTQRGRTLARAAGIEHVLRRPPRRLSQGERQRVAICRALITQPKAILCDEPTGNLDAATATTVLDLLFSRARTSGTALFMVTHNHDILNRFDRVVDITALNHATPIQACATASSDSNNPPADQLPDDEFPGGQFPGEAGA